ncbi:hypothetical protein CMI42_05035 [Candidatus Pacearchaeota archaeon]|nr:hypothetical protein [Candidatus Pacearchaeota archaeon]
MEKVDIIFEKVNKELPEKKGSIVAIEPESGDYFVGGNIMECLEKARMKHPDKLFHFKRIGSDVVYFVGAHDDTINKRLF